jgi:hypothetical protein
MAHARRRACSTGFQAVGMNYMSRHWRGELSLPVAFWVNNLLLMFPLGLVVRLMLQGLG